MTLERCEKQYYLNMLIFNAISRGKTVTHIRYACDVKLLPKAGAENICSRYDDALQYEENFAKVQFVNAKDSGKCSGVPLDNFRKVSVQLKGKSKSAVYCVKEDFEGYEVHPVK